MNWNVQLCELNYGREENEAVAKVLASEWLTMGAECDAFEKEFSAYIGHKNTGVLVSSATAALHLALMSIGVGYGDEVIVPGLTFVSDANVVLQLGAVPVFANSVSLENFNIDHNSVLDLITEKTKAIVVVHFAGFPLDLKDLSTVCRERGIILIEDCAHAPGASVREKYVGTFGDFSFFSFFSNKNIAIGEGGMVFAKNREHLDAVRLMRSHGMSSVTLDRHNGRATSYDVSTIGLNYRCDEIRAALGRVQLEKLPQGNMKRAKLYKLYAEIFSNTPVQMPFVNYELDCNSAYHIAPIILSPSVDRLKVIAHLKSFGIQTSIHYPHFGDFTAYKDLICKDDLGVVTEICARELTLPLHPKLSEETVSFVAEKVLEVI